MTAAVMRTFAFGDPALGIWGAALLSPQAPVGQADGGAVTDPAGVLMLGAAGETESPSASLEGAQAEETWRAEGPEVMLELSAEGSASPWGEGFDQLCRVRGQIGLAGVEHAVDCLGYRGTRSSDAFEKDVDSARDVFAWFEPGEGLALHSLRPRRAHGQEGDFVSAAVLGGEEAQAVSDPRLSTTYTSGGQPVRVSLELWLGADQDTEYPRRAAGVATGSRGSAVFGDYDIDAELLRCHSRGLDGAGVYLLVRRR